MTPFQRAIRISGIVLAGYLVLAGLFVRRWRRRYVAGMAVAAGVTVLLLPFDGELLRDVRSGDLAMHSGAETLSAWGKTDHVTLGVVGALLVVEGKTDHVTLGVVGALLVVALLRRRRRPARVALMVLLAVAVSGLGVNLLRPAFGRARPFSERAGDFTWLSAEHEFTSFPSGHASEAWAVTTVLAAAYPPLALPGGIYAGSMLWARMEAGRHHPADVFAGAAWGVLCALPFAWMARRGVRPRYSSTVSSGRAAAPSGRM